MRPKKDKLDKEELSRYSRSIMLPEIGTEGQLRLCGGKVLVVGCGALGSIVAMYLAGSGVGHISISDYDTVGLSNLQRQLSFTEHDVGALKTEATERRLRDINSGIEVLTLPEMITRSKARELFGEYDVIVECSDNPSTKYMVTDVAGEAGVPVVLGGVSGWTGQVVTLHCGGIRYRDIFPDRMRCSAVCRGWCAGSIARSGRVSAGLRGDQTARWLRRDARRQDAADRHEK